MARAGRVARHRGGLAGFDQPRFLQVEPHPAFDEPRVPTGDLIRGQALVGRAAIAVALVLVGPLLDRDADDVALVGWAIALAWLPGVGLLDLAQRRWGLRPLGAFALVWDVGLFVLVDVTLEAHTTAAIGYLVLTAFHAYVGGPRCALAAFGLCSGAALLVPFASGRRADLHTVIVELLALALLAWLLADASKRQDTSRAGLVQVSERAAAIVTGIADAVVVMSPWGRVREWNPAASRTFSCPQSHGLGARCAEVLGLHSGLRALHCDDGCALLDEGASGESVEVWRLDPTGRRQPLLASVAPVIDDAGTVVEVIHSVRDITALKAADEAKTLFLATASHELKTPLTVIHGFAQMLKQGQVPDEQRQHALRAIEVRSRELFGIVDRLLMSSRIEAGRIELELRPIEVEPLVRERAHSLRATTSRRIDVAAPEVVPVVHADTDALLTVIDHLVDNAVKYSPGGAPVRIELRSEPGEDCLVIAVHDDGIGMTPEQVEQCFERFWQAEVTDVRRFGGTGIGLYIVRSLVEGMGGRIEVRSTPGRGSTFAVALSTAAPVPPEEPEEPIAQDGERDGQSSMIREYMRQVGVPLQRAGGHP